MKRRMLMHGCGPRQVLPGAQAPLPASRAPLALSLISGPLTTRAGKDACAPGDLTRRSPRRWSIIRLHHRRCVPVAFKFKTTRSSAALSPNPPKFQRSMRYSLLQIVIALFLLAAGTIAGAFWQSHQGGAQDHAAARQGTEEKPWPLSKEIVVRSLQTHSFSTNKLRRNSNDEITWRWLKESIAAYPQNWVRLEIAEKEPYGVVIYPPKILDSAELAQRNKELNEKARPLLSAGKRYLPIQINQGNIVCPDWTGLVDIEEAKLVYFAGHSG